MKRDDQDDDFEDQIATKLIKLGEIDPMEDATEAYLTLAQTHRVAALVVLRGYSRTRIGSVGPNEAIIDGILNVIQNVGGRHSDLFRAAFAEYVKQALRDKEQRKYDA